MVTVPLWYTGDGGATCNASWALLRDAGAARLHVGRPDRHALRCLRWTARPGKPDEVGRCLDRRWGKLVSPNRMQPQTCTRNTHEHVVRHRVRRRLREGHRRRLRNDSLHLRGPAGYREDRQWGCGELPHIHDRRDLLSPSVGVALGSSAEGVPDIWHTDDGGSSWTQVTPVIQKP